VLITLLLASDLVARVDHIASQSLGNRAGMSVAVVRASETIIAKGYGFANVEQRAPATADTVYHIDSITKHITAGAILSLVEQGKLSLDDPVTAFVPQLGERWSKVRIRHLLSHTSGSESFTDLPTWGPQERLDVTPNDILALVRDVPFHFEPGTSWRYNNTGFYLLGMVIEKVAGQSYADYMTDHVFQPLGMTATRYGDFRPIIANRASGYELDHGTLVNAEPMSWKAPFAGGALCSTVMDLVRWERALEHRELIGPATLKLMRSPTIIDGVSLDYGFGTRIGTLGGHRVVGHTGNGGGFRNVLFRFPDDDLTIVVLTNTDGGEPSAGLIASRIARAVLGIADELLRDEPLPSALGEELSGTFESAEGAMIVSVRDGKLGFQSAPQGPFTPLRYQGKRAFAILPDVTLIMMPDSGKAQWGVLYVGGIFIDAGRRVR
jgi:D-alanyl-D-alanine carboxypeptidase